MANLFSSSPFSLLIGGLGPDTYNLDGNDSIAVVDLGEGAGQVAQDDVVFTNVQSDHLIEYRFGE